MTDSAGTTQDTVSLRNISVENFKAFSNSQDIPIKPITLIFGANSSGKSSILHSLLFLSQIQLDANSPHADVTFTDLGGNLVDLGGFPNVVYKHLKNNALRFSIGANIRLKSTLPVHFSVDIIFDKNGNVDTTSYFFNKKKLVSLINLSKRSDSITSLDGGKLATKVIFHNIQLLLDDSLKDIIEVHFYSKTNIQRRNIAAHTANNDFYTKFNNALTLIANSKIATDIQSSFLADRILINSAIPMLRLKQNSINLAFSMNEEELLKSMNREIKRSNSEIGVSNGDMADIYTILATLTEICINLSSNMMRQIQNTSYLGPLRKIPSRNFNELNERNQEHSTGLIAWRALSRNKRTTEQVNSWMKKLGINYRIISEQVYERSQLDQILQKKNQIGITLPEIEKLTPRDSHLRFEDLINKTSLSHRDLGIGVSQVLPIIVNAISLNNKLIIIEQPELHLHPRLQAELAELFIETAIQKNKQQNTYILETHSEHIILRILRRIREKKLSPNDVSILYVSPDKTGSIVTHIGIDDEGDFLDHWPDGFFEESHRERMSGR